jgi:hypothetical protein
MSSPSHAVAAYLSDLHQSLGVGVPETSGYPALRNLLNAVGETLKPKIAAVLHPSNTGAGLPDGGLFAAKDLRKYTDDAPPLVALKPERGVIEVKGLAQDITGIEQTSQVRTYLEHYGQILVTNYRTFALFSWQNGRPVPGERYVIADSEQAFWDKVHTLRNDPSHPEYERLWQFLRRALLSTARIGTPQDLAAFLASYAREARARVAVAPMGTLEPVKKALTDALGVHFSGERGTHFFQSTLIQTLFYGVFSAWVLWHESHPKSGDRFQWRLSAEHLGLPILRTLFVQLAGDPKKVRALQLEEVLDWTEECLARVDRTGFFARYDMGDAVQYFYEPFLAEFDPELRKDFGVWYTPPEIVRYMVERVDQSLRENFGLADGLADPSVIVLDPCCGTGAYLVESLRLIRRRLVEGYGETQAALKIREVAKKRLFGFELLPAPYVVAHLQIDLMLTRWGAALNHERDERAGVYLTNALTGWVPVRVPKNLPFAEFGDERDAADSVKQREHILVILGNPPYDGFADLAVEEERALTEAYRTTKAAAGPQGQGLNDLYVRFFRMAERRVAEGVPESDDPRPGDPREDAMGIVCYISNYSWLDGLSHTGMRERFMEVFDAISIDSLNGDKFKTGKRTPEGKPDPSVFSTERNREGIQVGTAIALLERWPKSIQPIGRAQVSPQVGQHGDFSPIASVRFRNWWGKEKRLELGTALKDTRSWTALQPALGLGLPFVPVGVRSEFTTWPSLISLMPTSFPGVKTSRDDALISVDRRELENRLSAYFDARRPLSSLTGRIASLTVSTNRFDAAKTRAELLQLGMESGRITRYLYRPFDLRWIYWHPRTKLLDEKRPDYAAQIKGENIWLSATQRNRMEGFYSPQVTRSLADHHIVESNVGLFPLYLFSDPDVHSQPTHPGLFGVEAELGAKPNLTVLANEYLERLGARPEDLFFHIVAVLHSPAYKHENGGALRQGWPRVPLPNDFSALERGAALGRQVAGLLDPEVSVAGVTGLQILPHLKGLGELAVGDPRQQAPEADLAVIARWGYSGQGGAVMPGLGRVTGSSRGDGFVDIHLNDTTRWKDVPERVWGYTLGGYPVLKKWLSYREKAVLGRPLTGDEAQTFTETVRRIEVLLSLHPLLDEHYHASI